MNIQELKTQVYKSLHGWQAKTLRTEQGRTFEISTNKTYQKIILSSVYEVNVEYHKTTGFVSTEYKDFMNPFMSVNHGAALANENNIKKFHYEALASFDQYIEREKKPYSPQIGDILFLDGYDKVKGSPENKHIIYKIEGRNYYTVEHESLELQIHNFVKDYAKKFGIGFYFTEGYNAASLGITADGINDLYLDALSAKKIADAQAEIDAIEAAKKAAEKREYLSQFKNADRRKTTSIIKTHCLANWPVKSIRINTEVFSGGDSMRVTYAAAEPVAALENFISNFQAGHFNGMEDIYEYRNMEEIILAGHILETYKYVFCEFEQAAQEQAAPQPEPVKMQAVEPIKAVAADFVIVADAYGFKRKQYI